MGLLFSAPVKLDDDWGMGPIRWKPPYKNERFFVISVSTMAIFDQQASKMVIRSQQTLVIKQSQPTEW